MLTHNSSAEYRISDPYHLVRYRINVLFADAVKNPVVTVCAKTGFGKTRAVSDYLRRADNPNILAFDDIHISTDPVIHEHLKNIEDGLSPDLKLILIYHEIPESLKQSIDALKEKGLVSVISEAELNFTETEVADCLKQQNVVIDRQSLRGVLNDTNGWAFAVSLAVRSLRRIPKYTGFVQVRLKPNIFEFIEHGYWTTISENLKRFLISLSLVDRLDAELVSLLAEKLDCKEDVLSEFRQQIAYIKFDDTQGIFIHNLYLDFLREKQNMLEEEEKNEVLKTSLKYKKQSAAV
jgi:LuxR family maltose regulon positive regulatory protein